jgi:hypothetical protein
MAAFGTSWVLVMRTDAIPCSFSLFPVGGTMARYLEYLSQFYGFHLTHLRNLVFVELYPKSVITFQDMRNEYRMKQ